MAYVSGYSSTQNSIQWEIGGLMYPANQYSNFRLELWLGSSYITTLNFTTGSSNTYTLNTFYNLSAGTTYRAKAWTRYNAGGAETYLGEASYSTQSPPAPQPPSSPPWISATADQYSSGWINVEWGASSNTDYYIVSIPSIGYSSGARTSTSASIGGLAEGTNYTVYVYAYSYSYGQGGWNFTSVTTKTFRPPDPGSISWVTVTPSTATRGRITVNWASTYNVTGYRIEIYNMNNTFITSDGTSSTSISFSGLAEYTQYYAKVYAQNSNGSMTVNGVANNYNYFWTADVTSPVISSISGDGKGKMYLSFGAYDSHSGLRSSSRYYTEISSRNGSTYGQGAYHNEAYRTFTVDASGLAFVHDSYYYMRVTTYDNANPANTTTSSIQIQYKVGRPNSWTWHGGAKVAGQNISLTADEWNSFCIRVNQFRQYKSLGNYGFSTAYSGNTITASIVNQARSAISDMSPPTSVPATATAGVTTITASYFNTLSSSLNSIP